MISFFIVDTETTGLSAVSHEVVEFSAIRVSDKTQISRTIKAQFPKNASLDALKITGKTIYDLYNGISRKQAVEDIENFFDSDNSSIESRCIIAHNGINFDRRMLHAMWEKENRIFPANLWIDTMPIVRDYAKKIGIQKPKVNLTAALEMVKIGSQNNLHTAKGDARATYKLWMRLLEEGIDYLQYIKRLPHKEEEDSFENSHE